MRSRADAYLAARAEFEVVHNELMDLSTAVGSVATALRSEPGQFVLSNIPGDLPPEVPMGARSKSFDGRQWPSAAQIQQLLIRWHAARGKMMGAWADIPDQARTSLQPPPASAK